MIFYLYLQPSSLNYRPEGVAVVVFIQGAVAAEESIGVNMWRTKDNARNLRAALKEGFGVDRAGDVPGRLPPRPLRGRWGSKFRAEDLSAEARQFSKY